MKNESDSSNEATETTKAQSPKEHKKLSKGMALAMGAVIVGAIVVPGGAAVAMTSGNDDGGSAVASQQITSKAQAKEFAKQYMKDHYGWGNEQYQALLKLWGNESGWDWHAKNASSGAYGIPQALPGKKMASAGPDWKENPETQIIWGLQYLKDTYGSPAAAWAHETSVGWY